MVIFDRKITKDILILTVSILRNNFLYSEESLKEFLTDFKDYLTEELDYFEEFADDEIIYRLTYDRMARTFFTCYFVSYHLRETLVNKLNFSEKELQAFESILPKYAGNGKMPIR